MHLTPNAIQALEDRYLLRDETGDITETPLELFRRVAFSVAEAEVTPSDKDRWADEFYRLMVPDDGGAPDFLPNTPTLMNAGKEKGQLSACFVLPIEDSMEGIFTTLKDAAIVHQTGGGTGFDFSRLRPEGSMVSNKSGVSTGPISFASVYNSATEAIKQGASRRGANMMNLRVDHPDILKFIDMKMVPGVMTNFNVSVTVTDEFMEALEGDTTYELRHPLTKTAGSLRARDVWRKIAENAHRSAEPGIIFIDRVNQKSPYAERIEATNPCGEQPLPPYGSCNLGSINLSKFVKLVATDDYAESGRLKPVVDWNRLRYVVRTAVRFLDNVIDVNEYPLEAIEDHTLRYRNIGLGGMGFAGMLQRLRIPYNSVDAVEFADALGYFLNLEAHFASVELAKEKGLPPGAPFPTFYDYSSPARRNATLTTWAPTGSLSVVADCDGGCEPSWEFFMERWILDKVLTFENPIYAEAKRDGWYSEKVFVSSHDITQEWHVDIQAALQNHCDSGISKTINLPEDATVEDIENAYIRAWRKGCKGLTVYRDGSREGVFHRIETQEDDSTDDACCDNPQIVKESGCETCKSCGTSKCLIA